MIVVVLLFMISSVMEHICNYIFVLDCELGLILYVMLQVAEISSLLLLLVSAGL
jgi:hypothetical protein